MQLRPAPIIEPDAQTALDVGRVPMSAGNASDLPYHGWTMAGGVPLRHLPPDTTWGFLMPHGLPVYLGRQHTTEHRLAFVYGRFEPFQGVLGHFEGREGPFPQEFISNQWLVDEPVKAIPFPEVDVEREDPDPTDGLPAPVETLVVTDLTHTVVHQDDVERVHFLRGRLSFRDGTKTPLMWQAWLYQMSGQPHADFDWRLMNSDASSEVFRYRVAEVRLRSGEFHSIDEGARYGFDPLPKPRKDGDRTLWVSRLRGETEMGDGVRFQFTGAIYGAPAGVPFDVVASPNYAGNQKVQNMMARLRGPAMCAVQRGVHDGTWLGLRRQPRLPTSVSNPISEVTSEYAAWRGQQGGDYFDLRPWGLAKSPGQTGDQEAFGATKLGRLVSTGNPLAAWMRMLCLSEPLRPVAYYERDATLVRVEDHPLWNTWVQRTHGWPNNDDTLGKKNDGGPWYDRGAVYGWNPADDQHFGYLDTDACYVATGRLMLRQMLRERTEPLLARFAEGASRGIGRTFQSMVNIVRLTDDRRLVERMYRDLAEKGVLAAASDQYRPWCFREIHTDPRVLKDAAGNPVEAAMVWQVGLEILGTRGLQHLMEDLEDDRWTQVEHLVLRVGTALVRKGWFRRASDGQWAMADAIAWNGGQLIPDSDYQDGNVPGKVHTSGYFGDWSLGAVEITRNLIQRMIDEGRDRPEHHVTLQRAEAILMQAGPPANWRSAEWRAVE